MQQDFNKALLNYPPKSSPKLNHNSNSNNLEIELLLTQEEQETNETNIKRTSEDINPSPDNFTDTSCTVLLSENDIESVKTKSNRRSLSIIPEANNNNLKINERDIIQIPEIIYKILHSRQRSIQLSKFPRIEKNKQYFKLDSICGLLRKEILNYSIEEIGATDEEANWAKYIIDNSDELTEF